MLTDPPQGPAAATWAPSEAFKWTLVAMALAALDLSLHLFQNWVPFDEGAMALAASLVRHGAWPHRDFVDIYSGGLALLGAGAQFLFGDDLRSLRIPFGIATIVWVAVLAACFRRFFPPAAAAGLALAAYLWGPPIYPAAMPSWYLLFLATAMIWCLFRWHETRRVEWWGAVGLLIGLGLTLKINAIFLLAAAGCVLLTDAEWRSGALGLLVISAGVIATALTVSNGWPLANAAPLLAPLIALTGVWAWHARRDGAVPPAELLRFFRPGLWLALGLAAVVVPWVVAYALHGGVRPLLEGVLVLPFRRTVFALLIPPAVAPVDLLGIGLLLALLFYRWSSVWAVRIAVLLIAVAFFVSEAARLAPGGIVRSAWQELRVWLCIALLAVAVFHARTRGPEGRPVIIAGWVAAWFALLQYPFGAVNYISYVAPLAFLAGAAAAARTIVRPIGAALVLSLSIWTLGVDHGQALTTFGYTHGFPDGPPARLDAPRGGLKVPEHFVYSYRAINEILDAWGARTIVAGPDAPEVYYLSDRPFVGREFFEVMAPRWSAEVFAQRIAAERPDALVLNTRPYFSRVGLDSVLALLPERPIADTTIGRFRLLRFRQADAPP